MLKILGEVKKHKTKQKNTTHEKPFESCFVLIVMHKASSSLYCKYFSCNIGHIAVSERRCHQRYKRCEGQVVKYNHSPWRKFVVFFCQVLNQYRVSSQAVQFVTREFNFFYPAVFCDCCFLYFSGTLNFMEVCISFHLKY